MPPKIQARKEFGQAYIIKIEDFRDLRNTGKKMKITKRKNIFVKQASHGALVSRKHKKLLKLHNKTIKRAKDLDN